MSPKQSGPCIAYIEFDDQGREAVPVGGATGSQLDRAIALIKKAIQDDPQHQPVILTFIHGWKHNASSGPPEDSNIQGFEHVLNYLYYDIYGGTNCSKVNSACNVISGHVVIGIYIGWRGEIISHDWPVARTISVYSRGMAANRVGRGAVIQALNAISQTAHPPDSADSPNQPMLIFIGHSFGARVLENTMNALYISSLSRAKAKSTELTSVPTFADLVVYVNSAAPATLAVPMLDYLAEQKLEYKEDLPNLPVGNGMGRDRPLMLSITTPADPATGILFPIAMGADGLLKKMAGSLSGNQSVECFNPATQETKTDTSKTKFNYYSSTAAHLDILQSHEVIDLGPPTPAGAPSACPSANSPDSYSYGIPGHCFRIEPKRPSPPEEIRCNNTPYWILNSDGNIIPDHGTIFTDRLIRFIGEFLPRSTATVIQVPRLSTPEQRLRMQLQPR